MANNKSLKVTCKAAGVVPLSKLTPLQGNLKTLSQANYEKLKASLITHGVTFPFFAWKAGKTVYTLDGHQRDSVLRRMQQEGWEIPDIPVAWIEAESLEDAKKKILLISSRYGQITEEGLKEFGVGLDLSGLSEMVSIPDFNVDFGKLFPSADVTVPDVSAAATGSNKEEDARITPTGVVSLMNADEAILPSSNKWGIPDLLPEMLADQVPETVYYRQPVFTASKTLFVTGWLPAHRDIHMVEGGILAYYAWDDRFRGVWGDMPGTTQQLLDEKWGAVVSPNFSTFRDDPLAVQLHAMYKNRWVARYWQEVGIKIIPDMNWSDERSFEFCFLGIPKNPPVVSVVCQAFSPKHDADSMSASWFQKAFQEMVKQVEPHKVIMYAGEQHQEEIEKFIPYGPQYIWLTSVISMRKKAGMVKETKKKSTKGRRIPAQKEVQGAAATITT